MKEKKMEIGSLLKSRESPDTISSNAVLLFKSFDLYSVIRKPALVTLSKGLKLNTASRVFDVASSVISRARSSVDIVVLYLSDGRNKF